MSSGGASGTPMNRNSIGSIARRLGVDRDTIKTWTFLFSDFFDPSANPNKGQARIYSDTDVRVLTYIAYCQDLYAPEDFEYYVQAALARGEHNHDQDVLLNTPLFQSIPEEVSEDWTHGAIIGGFGTYKRRFFIAQSYRRTGDGLLESAEKYDDPIDGVLAIYPILFVYRQAIELYLKIITDTEDKIHDIKELTGRLEAVCKDRYKINLPVWVVERLYELGDVDTKQAIAFRYENTETEGLVNEYWVEWNQLHLVMNQTCNVLERLITKFKAAEAIV